MPVDQYAIRLVRFAHRRPLTACLWIMLALSAFFLLLPSVDIAFARWFHDPELGFALFQEPVLRRLRELGLFTPKLIAIVLVAVLVLKLLMPRVRSIIPPNVTLFFLSSLIVGPGLVVNLLLKGEWGRPRPRNTDLFGGDLPFMPPWVWSDYCAGNCSFVSGEASSSFWTLAIAFVVPKRWRRPALAVLIPYVVLISFNRIFFGAHYLSDVLLAWTLNFAVLIVFYRLTVTDPPPMLRERRLENGLTALGFLIVPKGSWLDRLRSAH